MVKKIPDPNSQIPNIEWLRHNNIIITLLGFGIWVIGILLLLAGFSFAAYVPDEVVVKFKTPIIAAPQGTVILDTFGVKKIEKVFPDEPHAAGVVSAPGTNLSQIYRFILPKNSDVLKTAGELMKLPQVEYAQPNYILRALLVPNDAYYSSQWGLPKISAEAAWDGMTGSASVTVAVIDTGILYTHADLSGKIILGYDYANNDNDPIDDNGHGTHVAGIIGAATNNSKGVAGINWNSKVMAVKVLGSGGQGSSVDVARGINYAANNGASVLNISLGDYADSSAIKDAVIDAYNKGCVIVAAAGNENTSTKMYPAAYDDYVIAVAATDQNDKRSDWGLDSEGNPAASNYGDWVDVSAPGTSIYSTFYNGSYISKNGTSMATPFVSGLASLLLSQNPAPSPSEVRRRIENSCNSIDPLNPGFEGKLGRGRINAARAMGYPAALISSPASGSHVSGTILVTGSASSINLTKYQIMVGTGSSATLFETLHESAQEVPSGTLYAFNTASKPDGLYTLKLVCQTSVSLTSEASAVTTIDNTSPAAVIASPSSGSSITGNVKITGTASDANLSYYSLSYAKDGDFISITSSATPETNDTLGYWNTSGLTGAYRLKLRAVDAASNAAEQIITVNIEATSESGGLSIQGTSKSTPNPFNPSSQSETYISYSLSDNMPATVFIFSISGELLYTRSFSSGENGGKADDNLVPWDGRDPNGAVVGGGVYFYKIATPSSGGKRVIGSGRIIVVRN